MANSEKVVRASRRQPGTTRRNVCTVCVGTTGPFDGGRINLPKLLMKAAKLPSALGTPLRLLEPTGPLQSLASADA